MSRLQAPGFSLRLKQPGVPTGIPQASTQQAEPVFKKPNTLPLSIRPPTSNSTANNTFRKTSNTSSQKQLQSPTHTNHHGQSPYERNKPNANQIPYVGKKRSIGTLKAPVSRIKPPVLNGIPGNNENQKPAESKLGGLYNQQNKTSESQTNVPKNITAFKKPSQVGIPQTRQTQLKPPTMQSKTTNALPKQPIRRQLIPDTSSAKKTSGLPRPGSADITRPSFGVIKPRSQSRGANKSNVSNSSISSNKSISKSLQALPVKKTALQNNKPISSKSASQSDLRKPAIGQLKKRSQSGSIPQKRQGPVAKFGFANGPPRQRVLSNKLNSTAVMSTPCMTATKLRDVIKISPIVKDFDNNNTLELSHIQNLELTHNVIVNNDSLIVDNNLNESEIMNHDNEAEISSPEFEEMIDDEIDGVVPSDQLDLLGETDLDINNVNKQPINETNFFNQTHVIQNSALNNTVNLTKNNVANNTVNLPDSSANRVAPSDELDLLGETDLDFNNLNQQPNNDTVYFNQTHVIQNPALNTTVNLTKNNVANNTVNLTDNDLEKNTNNNPANTTYAFEQFNKTQVIEPVGDQLHEELDVANHTKIITNNLSETQTLDFSHNKTEMNHDFNKTQVLEKLSNMEQIETLTESLQKNLSITPDDVLNESYDFIGNAEMPLHLGCNDTPLKNISLFDELSQDLSFTQDVKMIIEALSSASGSQFSEQAIMSTSPIKSANPIKHSDCIMSHVEMPTDNQNTDITDEEEFALVDLPRSLSMSEEPKTPIKDDTEFEYDLGCRSHTISLGALGRGEGKQAKIRRHNTLGSQDLLRKFRVPKQMNTMETLEGNILMDNTTYLHFTNEVKATKTMLLKLRRTLLEADCSSPLVKDTLMRAPSSPRSSHDHNQPPLSPRSTFASPLAVVDPLVMADPSLLSERNNNEEEKPTERCGEDVSSLSNNFTQALRRIEELEKTNECSQYTIKLLQTQLENYEQKEENILEENIILREQNGMLNEKLQAIANGRPLNSARERTISTGSSYEDVDIGDSRKHILQRLYSNEMSE